MQGTVTIRNAIPADVDAVVVLDQIHSSEAKPEYWKDIFTHYVTSGRQDRVVLMAEAEGKILGFIVAEVRAWEFGSPPCGWVTALIISPDARELGIGKQMFEEVSTRFKKQGVQTLRTMVDRDNKLTLSFFRSLGMRTGSYIELEKKLD